MKTLFFVLLFGTLLLVGCGKEQAPETQRLTTPPPEDVIQHEDPVPVASPPEDAPDLNLDDVFSDGGDLVPPGIPS